MKNFNRTKNFKLTIHVNLIIKLLSFVRMVMYCLCILQSKVDVNIELCYHNFHSTVKPVYSDCPRETQQMVFVDRFF